MSCHLVDPKPFERPIFEKRKGIVRFEGLVDTFQEQFQCFHHICLGYGGTCVDGEIQLVQKIGGISTVVTYLTATVEVKKFEVRFVWKCLNYKKIIINSSESFTNFETKNLREKKLKKCWKKLVKTCDEVIIKVEAQRNLSLY